MSVTIRTSRTTPGNGVMRAMTIPNTASGTASSRRFPRVAGDGRRHEGSAEVPASAFPSAMNQFLPATGLRPSITR